MKNPIGLLGTLGIGAGLMYFLDPDRGKRRRALVKDRAAKLSNTANNRLQKTAVDLRNRTQGVWFEAEKLFEDEEILTDEKLEGKIRTRLGRLTSHPHVVKTAVENGKVILSGYVLIDEEASVVEGVKTICGVNEVENRLETHAESEHFEKLQGADERRKAFLERQKDWSPQTRILTAAAGGGLALFGATKRNSLSALLSSVGFGLLVRSAFNQPLGEMLARSGETKPIKVQKTITINAPREAVFDVMKYPQYFPYFMSHVQKVEPSGEKCFEWTVDGIGGFPVGWTTEVTEVVPNELIRWKNAGSERNGQSGSLHLEEADGGATRLHVEMNYAPVGGKLGHFAAALFGRDPKSEMDDDLLRLKTYIEKGKLPRDAAIADERSNEMKVREIMTENPMFATINTSLQTVAQMMAENDCGIVPVVETAEDKKPVGVITDRDLTLRTIAHNKNPLNMVAGEVMTDTVITVKPDESVEDCIARMENNQIRRVLVVDDAGNLNGIVAQADIARQAPPFETAELLKDVSMTQTATA